MKKFLASTGTLGFVAAALLLGACGGSSGGGDTGGSTGTGGTPAGGTTGQTGGSTGQTGGSTGTGGTGGSTTPTGGTGGTPAGGTGGSTTPTGGTGGTPTGGAGGTPTGGTGGTPTGGTGGTAAPKMSPGCGMPPASDDSPTNFILRKISVAGVDPAFVAAHPPTTSKTSYTWSMRNYAIRLPKSYSPGKPYALDLEGTGCGGNDTVGKGGDYTEPPTADQTVAIQIGLSYLPSDSVNTCATFADGYTNSPEPEYMRAVITDIESKYCVNMNQVFVNGYSSGAWEAALSGCTNTDQVRAFGVQIGGGLRTRPACSGKAAAMFVVGLTDTGNPIGPLATAQNMSLGSVGLRDEILHRNGCVAPDFQIVDTCSMGTPNICAAGIQPGDTYSNVPHAMWNAAYPKCQMYTGCPAQYPVVWCPLNVNHGNGPMPMGTDADPILFNYRRTGMWEFFTSLPPE